MSYRKPEAQPSDIPPALLCPELVPVELVHSNPWFKVLSRGSYFTLEYERPQVVIVPLLGEHEVVMVRVHRPVIHDSPLELPAGDSHDGETPRQAAAREFSEETGICIPDETRFIPELPISEMPGRIPVLLSVFSVQVRKNEFDSRKIHDREIVSVEAIPLNKIANMISSGEIYLSSPCAILSRLIFKKLSHLLNNGEEHEGRS